MMKKLLLVIPLLGFMLAGCVAPPPPLTPLQIQAMQTREFDASKKQVYTAAMTMLQNSSFTVQKSNAGTGFIQAKGLTKTTTQSPNLLANFLKDANSFDSDRDSKNSVNVISTNTMTISVVPLGAKKTRIRINIISTQKTSSG